MSDNPSADPFTRAFTRLWDVLLEDADFLAAVRAGNRPKGDTEGALRDRSHVASALPGDRDIVFIMPGPGSTYPLSGTSTSYKWVQVFSVQLVTDSLGFVERLFPLKYKVLRAIERGRKAHGPTLGLDDLIVDVQPTDTLETNTPSDLNADSQRWAAVIGIAVQMRIPKTSLTGAT